MTDPEQYHLSDAVALAGTRLTRDGYLVASARIARTGVQNYLGAEVGRRDTPLVRVYRPEEEVFDHEALASLAHRPITIDHPGEAVTAGNWRRHAIGATGGEVARDGDFVRVPLALMDGAAIAAVQDGKRQLSVGYTCTLDWTPGVTPSGEAYDAIQRGIRANHLAVVDAARAGSACRIGDQTSEDKKVMTAQKMTIDGITVEMSDTAAQVVGKVMQARDAAEAARSSAETALAQAKAAHKSEVDARDGKIAALERQLKDSELTADKLDALIAERQAVIDKAKSILPTLASAGKSVAQIRREAVASRFGDAAVRDKSDDYVAAYFDGMTSAIVPADPVRDAFKGAAPVLGDAASQRKAVYQAYCANLSSAHSATK